MVECISEILGPGERNFGPPCRKGLGPSGLVALTRRLWKAAMGSELSYFSPQGEGGTRPALPQLPIRAKDLGLRVHTP